MNESNEENALPEPRTTRGSALSSGVRCLAESAFAVAMVFLLILGLSRLAESRARQPIEPDEEGRIVLLVGEATLLGSLRAEPTVLEQQTEDFAYHFGQELAKERRSRVVRKWSGSEDAAEWTFRATTPGVYNVAVTYRAPQASAEGQFEVGVADQTLTATVSSAGGRGRQAKPHKIGQVTLEAAGTYRLVIRPTQSVEEGLMILRSATLRSAK